MSILMEFMTKVTGPIEHYEPYVIAIALNGVKRKLVQEMNQQYKSGDPEFIAKKKSNVATLRKIRKDLISIEKYFTKKY